MACLALLRFAGFALDSRETTEQHRKWLVVKSETAGGVLRNPRSFTREVLQDEFNRRTSGRSDQLDT
tara:strand:- start:325047 stop:325247 length:201 start_codon:yes stop_codon:yes gene_type:complete